MMDNLFFDRQGRPISMERYGELFSDMIGYRRIAETTIGQWWVSTVWLGVDHAFGAGPPVIFETMPFYRGDVESLHPELRDWHMGCCRYGTEAEAVAGHDRVCVDLRVLIENVAMADEVMAEALAKGSGPDQGSGN